MLDMLCLTGEVGWARLSPRPAELTAARAARRRHADRAVPARARRGVAGAAAGRGRSRAQHSPTTRSARARRAARTRRVVLQRLAPRVRPRRRDTRAQALGALVAAAWPRRTASPACERSSGARAGARCRTIGAASFAGRWTRIDEPADGADGARAPSRPQAWALLRRYGVVFRRLLTRETNAAPWRELARVYRRLEARGEIRGGRFVIRHVGRAVRAAGRRRAAARGAARARPTAGSSRSAPPIR